jgi:hypothetical protein
MYDWLELLDTPDHSAGVVEVRRIGLLFRGGYHPDGEARYPVEVRYLTPLTPMARAMLKAK